MSMYPDSEELHKEYVRQIRAVGQTLIKNAESIAGQEKYLRSLYISIDLDPDILVPEINVTRGFLPDSYVEDQK